MNPEHSKEAVLRCWDQFYEHNYEYNKDNTASQKDLRIIFLSSAVIGLTTYDADMDLLIGKEIHEVMKVIFEGKNFEYIADYNNYIKYIKNIHYFLDWVNWGTSIRGAWFDYNDGNRIQLQDYGFEWIELSEEFMRWFLYSFL